MRCCALLALLLAGVPAEAAQDAPVTADPAGIDAPSSLPVLSTPQPPASIAVASTHAHTCADGSLRGKACRVDWPRLLGQSFLFLSIQHGGNIVMDSDTRYELTHGSFWGDYTACVEHYRWWRWKDDDPFGVDYIGHPMMGSITSSLYEQNDPKQRSLTFENTRRYWMGRTRAMAYSAAYSAQWKIGPLSEASIGNTGIGYYVRRRDGVWTNETGMQDFFITPLGGMAWNVGEDLIDRFLFRRVLRARRNRALLFAASVMTPTRSAANVLRFRAPYYRDPSASRAELGDEVRTAAAPARSAPSPAEAEAGR